ncbi:hypothetical protein GI374_13385 [Paracoccus sp. S-4012]|uniref:SPOR domain-containing protein n=1 Tax=Paracoccus sp. S-4012 TaxID=2665648 RepID=UPI0012B0C8C8|nr:SPOR domain-containing protein [Paracoccus sp. S-4012]MRX51417.1 hypothetical protein [Paracoccus sp. S-4012]
MLRVLAGMGAWLLLAAGGPAEAPPSDFAGRQYIDSTGCVFLREGPGWTPRLDPGGEAVCGYPPTRLARDDGPPTLAENDPRLVPPGMDPVEARLLAEVAGVMGDAVPPALAAEAPPATGDLGAQIAAGLDLAPRLAAASATPPARSRDSRLCEMIGATPAGPEIGARDLLGYCGAAAIDAAARRPLPVEAVANAPAVAPPRQSADAGQAGRADRRQSRSGRAPSGTGGVALPEPASLTAGGRSPPAVPMIPAGARYFVLSRHADDTSLRAAAARLVSEGFPAAIAARRGGTGRDLMAGPFPDREAMVRALDGLRRAGYRDPVPR